MVRGHSCDKCPVTVEGEGVLVIRQDVYHSFFAERGDWCFVTIELTFQFFVCSECLIIARDLQHIESVLGSILLHGWIGQLWSSMATWAMMW